MNSYLSEMSYISDTSIDDINAESFDVVTPLKSTLTEPSVSLSGTVRIEEIRRIQNITEEIKPACAKTSSLCGICVDKARIAVQVVCNELY